MNRCHGAGYREAITAAHRLIPERLHPLLAADFACGIDPVFAGLHHYERASYGRSYRTTSHVTYGFHQHHMPPTQRATTVVLIDPEHPRVIVHELGHVLHERLRFDPAPEPVTRYAAGDRWEAFAEAFTAWCLPGYTTRPVDPATRALLDRLAA